MIKFSTLRKVLNALYWRLASFPFALFLLMLSPVIKVRLIGIISRHIGHFSLNVDYTLCALQADFFGQHNNVRYLFYTQPEISNKQLYKMWKRIITIIPFPRMCSWVNYWLCILSSSYRNDKYRSNVTRNTWGYDINSFMEKFPYPNLSFTKRENELGQSLLRQLGIPVGAKYVCLLVRDAAYDKKYHQLASSGDNIRNASISTYKKAINFLTSKGYYVIRMGKEVENKMDIGSNLFIDYATSSLRSDFLDIYLSARCHFFMTTSSGLDGIASLFRRPLLITNYSFLGELLFWYKSTVLIFKELRHKNTREVVTIEERLRCASSLVNGKLANYMNKLRRKIQLSAYTYTDNSEDELLWATEEMVARMEGQYQPTDEDIQRQEKFYRLFCEAFEDAGDRNFCISICSKFLKNCAFDSPAEMPERENSACAVTEELPSR